MVIYIASCQNKYETLAEDLKESANVEIVRVNSDNRLEIKAVKEYIKEQNTARSYSSDMLVNFDKNNISEYEISGRDIRFYIAPQIGFDENGNINYVETFLLKDNKVVFSSIIKEELSDDRKTKQTTYFNDEFEPLFRIIVDKATNQIRIEDMASVERLTYSESGGDACILNCVNEVSNDWGGPVLLFDAFHLFVQEWMRLLLQLVL